MAEAGDRKAHAAENIRRLPDPIFIRLDKVRPAEDRPDRLTENVVDLCDHIEDPGMRAADEHAEFFSEIEDETDLVAEIIFYKTLLR